MAQQPVSPVASTTSESAASRPSTADSTSERPRAARQPTSPRSTSDEAAAEQGTRQHAGTAHQQTLPSTAWEKRYQRAVVCGDVLATLLVVGAAGVLRSGFALPHGQQFWMALLTALAVIAALPAARAWNQRLLGEGAEEFRRLGKGLFTAAVLLAMGGLLVGEVYVRPWVFLVLPVLAAVLFPLRYLLRQVLHRARRRGRCLLPVMAAGSPETVRDLIERTRLESHVGWKVEAACTPGGTAPDGSGELDGVPIVGTLDDIANHVGRGGYRVVAVTADAEWNPQRLRQLAWDLEKTTAEMVVAPTLMEVAGPRLHVSGVLGMPLLRVSAPAFTGGRRVVKEIVDRLGSAVLLTVLAPLLLVISLAVKLGDGGPVFYRQLRIGRDGTPFTMWKFRTMVVDAERRRDELSAVNDGDGPLFKLRRDPRVTRVGALLRRYSLDELPQLVNVFAGRMSMVGPRPPLPEETQTYSADVRRRLLVKPGLTGLWQVSGRSDLSWAEAIRLDLRYVEDWSLALDAVILWKTLRAVISGNGAY